MKYLITGGAGFIGSNFIKYMLDKYPNGYYVCLDLLTYASSMESLEEVINNDNFKFIHGDICDVELVDKLFSEEKFDFVVNFAAESHVDRSFIYSDLFYKTNVLGTKTLMDAAIKYNVKRFHQVSTDEVYGELAFDDPNSFTESSPLNPRSPYSISKAEADKLVLEYFNKYDLDITISRSTNNYGIYQHPEKLIPKVVKTALNHEKVTVYGDGLNVRDWMYVLDHCYAIDLILHQGNKGEIYNVGANTELANIEVIKLVFEKLKLENIPLLYTSDRPNDDIRYSLNCNKIKEELNWEVQSKFNESFEETVLWFKNNLDWMERILNK